MASTVLYPPIVESYMPAFGVNENICKVYFSLSKFNSYKDIEKGSIQAVVTKQDTGMNVVKKTNNTDENKYRETGIILNLIPKKSDSEDNLFYIEISNDDLYTKTSKQTGGWISGWLYKVQLRLSEVIYDPNGEDKGTSQSKWIQDKANKFSEWSTVCIVKATTPADYQIPLLNIDTTNENVNTETVHTLYLTTLELTGSFIRSDKKEYIYYYNFNLYDSNDNELDSSGNIYANEYQNSDAIYYLFKTELKDNTNYKVSFHYKTINGYEGGFDKVQILCSTYALDLPPCRLLTVDSDYENILKDITSLQEEEEEGRIALKLYQETSTLWSGNLCIRRSDSRDNFEKWTDVANYVIKQKNIMDLPLIYDYTIESGVWYKYGVQTVKVLENGEKERGILRPIIKPIMRTFNYSYLLGKDGKQLKLMFDNTMTNFKYQIYDSKIDPIGSKYPVIARNASIYYRTFPINGLISFWMDDNKVFCDKAEIYKYEDVIEQYEEYNTKHNIVQYDYIYEKDFRDKVLEFLQDGECKLFKSPTEGNIIVRLMDINCVPNQSLDRMLYSFSSNAFEIDDANLDNYLKYGFYKLNEYGTDFSVIETKIGQLYMDFKPNQNIFTEIYNKYDSAKHNIAGYRKTITNVHHLKITFDDIPLRIYNYTNSEQTGKGELTIGNNFKLNGRIFTVYDNVREYEFDERLNFNILDTNKKKRDELYLLADAQGKVSSVHATIDFLYDMTTKVYEEKRIRSRTPYRGIGQTFKECIPNENLYIDIYYKYFFDTDTKYKRLYSLSSLELEANPGAAFFIRDAEDTLGETHVIGETGILHLFEIEDVKSLIYLGMQDPDTGEIKQEKTDVILTYLYVTMEGDYASST